MPSRSTQISPAAAETRLRADHMELADRCQELCALAREGDWSAVDEAWDDFAGEIEAHLAFEERNVFPALATGTDDGTGLVGRLLDQHATIRQRLEEMGVEIQLHLIRAPTVDDLVSALREHTQLEVERVYPWLEAHR